MRMMVIGLSLALALSIGASSAHATHILAAPGTITASSQFSGGFAIGFLIDAISVTDADIGVTSSFGGQYAGSGPGPHSVFMDYGSSITADGFVYSQRLGGNPATDKVVSFEFWFLNADPGGVTPVTTADATVASSNTVDPVLTQETLSGSFSGQYVVMRITGNGGNPGGSELRLTNVPEPTSMLLAGIGCVGLFCMRRRRRS